MFQIENRRGGAGVRALKYTVSQKQSLIKKSIDFSKAAQRGVQSSYTPGFWGALDTWVLATWVLTGATPPVLVPNGDPSPSQSPQQAHPKPSDGCRKR